MEAIKVTPETFEAIVTKLKMACDAKKDYECVIRQHDSSLKARQRALAKIWYKDIAEAQGLTVGASEGFCKYHYGFKIRCEDDEILAAMIRKMLDGRDYEQKLEIIELYSEFFPILRDKNGMTSEQQGRYLSEMQRGMGQQGVFLSSINERELLFCREAHNERR